MNTKKIGLIIIYVLLVTNFLFSCKYSKKNIDTNINDSIAINSDQNRLLEDTLKTKLPIGKKELLLNNIESKIAKDSSLLLEILKYYDTINGIASIHFKTIDDVNLNSFYKPDLSDSKDSKDSVFLKSEEGYNFFKLVKELSIINDKKLSIFEGKSSSLDYDGNMIFTNRKDLVILDNKNNIVDALNIYYSYSDGIFAKTKLFFIDKDYSISIRYYMEDEEGKVNFSDIEKFKITNEGEILSIKP
ncbi:hypothetical protein J8L88_16475 [Aquimarina sp. MMG015]|uniref:hypothetical protein n=1 Tax=Aquimarina sp. MMG015 TaxID=2822689 RepID=UPI001B3A444F|nr:hypothetical protein [Aquimarina sp. MMG015]MBQ4804458.1 hypothetical protein [Aquimarina sp. MMG015]